MKNKTVSNLPKREMNFFWNGFIIGILIGISPFVISVINKTRINNEKEEMFLEFARNLVESVKTGTPISKSIINVRGKSYGALSENINKLASQISLGIPLNSALKIFAKDVNNSTFVFADGAPIAKSFYFLYGEKQERIAGMDFLYSFIEKCNHDKLKIAFLGSTEEVLNKTSQRIKNEFPNIKITNLISPPFGKKWENDRYIRELNFTETNAVFVALGCPKQEKWMSANHQRINSVLLGIGGALPVFAGEVKRCPRWMRDNSLEWLYRLIKEPRRMFKRYLYTNSKFLFIIAREKIKYVFQTS